MLSKHGYLMLPDVFADKITLVIVFTDETVTQCNFSVVKVILLVLVI